MVSRLIESLKQLERGAVDWRDYSTEAKGKSVAAVAKQCRVAIENLDELLDQERKALTCSIFEVVDGVNPAAMKIIDDALDKCFQRLKDTLHDCHTNTD